MGAFTLFAAYCIVMQPTYLGYLPTNGEYPDLWPTIYMTMNLMVSIGLVIAGICRVAVQQGRRGGGG